MQSEITRESQRGDGQYRGMGTDNEPVLIGAQTHSGIANRGYLSQWTVAYAFSAAIPLLAADIIHIHSHMRCDASEGRRLANNLMERSKLSEKSHMYLYMNLKSFIDEC